ncbi:MAG: serine/threonine protein kinase [Planctomycetes bacterium]|nr:serine/threonine protein kinase [Planctomycetota bacterium]
MTSHQHLRQLFDRALDVPPADRAGFLAEACGGDEALRLRLLAMLNAADDEHFLGAATSPGTITTDQMATLGEGPGSRIGPYKLLQQIGEGGFGVVFLAEQTQPVARKVALKIVKLGMDTRQVIARFEQERQALALMDHPNIARVVDAGATDTGRPFFVMDLVKGMPIVEYCDRNRLTLDERLVLFTQVCNAVQHAHGKGIIHRDLKSSNVLVTTQDGRPMAKVIDFGIAKATSQKLTDKTLFTEHQPVIGTLQYMSPEQAAGSLDIDTRTDVYSLGVLLYELLTGSTPFDSKTIQDAMLGEIQRIIREVDPPRPSTRLSDSQEVLASIAAHRRVEPKRLGLLLRGDLDWIVMMALEKDRARRYGTADGLAADIARHLAGEPVLAAPPSRSYQLRKFVRRHRGPVLASALLASSLLLGVIAFAWQASIAADEAVRARGAEAATQQRVTELQLVIDFQGSMLEQVDPTQAGLRLTDDVLTKFDAALQKAGVKGDEREQVTATFRSGWQRLNATDIACSLIDSTILQPAVAAIDETLATQPTVAASMREVLGERYRELGMLDKALPLLTEALATMRAQLGKEHKVTLSYIESLCSLHHDRGDVEAERALCEEALALGRSTLGELAPFTLRAINNMGLSLRSRGQFAAAEPWYREALAKMRQVFGETDERTLTVKNNLGYLLGELGKLEEAESLLRLAYAECRATLGDEHTETLSTQNNLAIVLQDVGKPNEAEPLLRQQLEVYRRRGGEEHPDTLRTLNNLGQLMKDLGRQGEAEPLFREALAARIRRYGKEHIDTLVPMNNLGLLLSEQSRLAEAEPLLRETLELRRRVRGPDHLETLNSVNNLANLLSEQRRHDEAEALLRDGLQRRRRLFGDNHPGTLGAINNLGMMLYGAGRPTEAEPLLREAVTRLKAKLGENHQYSTQAMTNLGSTLLAQNRFDEAEALFREALERQTQAFGAEHPTTLGTQIAFAQLRNLQGRYTEALALLEPIDSAMRRLAAARSTSSLPIFLVRRGRAMTGIATSNEDRSAAETILTEAWQLLEQMQGTTGREAKACAQAFVDLYRAWAAADAAGAHASRAAEWQARYDAMGK